MVWIKAKEHLASWRIVVNRYCIKTLLPSVKKKIKKNKRPSKLLPERQLNSIQLVKDTQGSLLLVSPVCCGVVSIAELAADGYKWL